MLFVCIFRLELELERDKRERDAREREMRERELREMEFREKMKAELEMKPPGGFTYLIIKHCGNQIQPSILEISLNNSKIFIEYF